MGRATPSRLTYALENIRQLAGRSRSLEFALAIRLIGLALGGKTYKLKFGHHGGNHPVQNTGSGKLRSRRITTTLLSILTR